MAKLGSFGVTHELEEETFDYFGQEMRVHPQVGPLLLEEFATRAAAATAAMEAADGTPTPEAMSFTRSFVSMFVHPDDFEAFWALALSNRQTPDEVIKVGMKLIELLSTRPTEQPSDSSAGLPKTEPNSKDDSYSRVMHRLEGRPDLQLMVLEAKEHESLVRSA